MRSILMKIDNCQPIVTVLRNFAHNIYLHHNDFIEKEDDEALHQLRVNIRKSRAILNTFHTLFNEQNYQTIDKELAKIAKKSNKSRNLDVFLEACEDEFAPYVKKLPKKFYKMLMDKRKKKRKKLIKFLNSRDVKQMILNYFAFLYDKTNQLMDKKEVDLLVHLEKSIDDIVEEIHLFYRAYQEHREEKILHKIRLHFKKIRYLLEAFQSYMPQKKEEVMLETSKQLQKELGNLHDLSIQELIIEDYRQNYGNKKAFEVFVEAIQKQKRLLTMSIESLLEEMNNAK